MSPGLVVHGLPRGLSPDALAQRLVDGKLKTVIEQQFQVEADPAFPGLSSSLIRDLDYRVEMDPAAVARKLFHNGWNAQLQVNDGKSNGYRKCRVSLPPGTKGTISEMHIDDKKTKVDLEYDTFAGNIVTASMKGRRAVMEDQHLVARFSVRSGEEILDIRLQGVFDGHSGGDAS